MEKINKFTRMISFLSLTKWANLAYCKHFTHFIHFWCRLGQKARTKYNSSKGVRAKRKNLLLPIFLSSHCLRMILQTEKADGLVKIFDKYLRGLNVKTSTSEPKMAPQVNILKAAYLLKVLMQINTINPLLVLVLVRCRCTGPG